MFLLRRTNPFLLFHWYQTSILRWYSGDLDELEFLSDIFTIHFQSSPNIDKELIDQAKKVEKLAEVLKVPCFPHEKGMKELVPGVHLSLAEEYTLHKYPALKHEMAALKLAMVDQIESQALFRCLHCRRFVSITEKSEIQGLKLKCPSGKSKKDNKRCRPLRVELEEVFFKITNLWAKKLLMGR